MEFQKKCYDKMMFKKSGVTIVFVSHSLEDVERICDRVMWIDNHNVRMIGAPWEIVKGYCSIDILLLTKEKALSNFRNHNRLFLDIAVEGIIILDKDNFLKNLMLETGEYARQRGIKRFRDG